VLHKSRHQNFFNLFYLGPPAPRRGTLDSGGVNVGPTPYHTQSPIHHTQAFTDTSFRDVLLLLTPFRLPIRCRCAPAFPMDMSAGRQPAEGLPPPRNRTAASTRTILTNTPKARCMTCLQQCCQFFPRIYVFQLRVCWERRLVSVLVYFCCAQNTLLWVLNAHIRIYVHPQLNVFPWVALFRFQHPSKSCGPEFCFVLLSAVCVLFSAWR